jgi:hypothetical protein
VASNKGTLPVHWQSLTEKHLLVEWQLPSQNEGISQLEYETTSESTETSFRQKI